MQTHYLELCGRLGRLGMCGPTRIGSF